MSTVCLNCDAAIEPAAPRCPFCGTITAHGRQLQQAAAAKAARDREAQEEQERQAKEQRDQALERSMGKAATFSLIAGIAGLVTCIFPVGCVLAILMGIKTRRISRETGAVKPARATVGLLLGSLGFLAAAAGWSWVFYDLNISDRNIEQLQTATASIVNKRALNPSGACKLAQLEILENGTYPISSADQILCRGALKRDDDRVVLPHIKIVKTYSKTVKACLRWTGSAWVVDEIREKGDCWSKPKPAAAATPKAPPKETAAPTAAPQDAAAPKAPSSTEFSRDGGDSTSSF